MKSRVKAETIGFILFVVCGFIRLVFPKFWFDETIWWSVAGVFVLALLLELCFVSPYEHVRALVEDHNNATSKLKHQITLINNEVTALKEQLKPRLAVEYKEDGQCNLSASATSEAHFRARLNLEGTEIARHLIATVKALRQDEHNMVLTEPIRLRFHNSKNFAAELEEMNPGTDELLDIFRLTSAGLVLAIARVYNSFDWVAYDPGHTYEVDISIGSSSPRKDFTFVCDWTGDFNTTKCNIKPPSSVPNKEASPHLPAS